MKRGGCLVEVTRLPNPGIWGREGRGGEGWEGMEKMVWWGEGRREERDVDWEDEIVRYPWRGCAVGAKFTSNVRSVYCKQRRIDLT